MARWSPRDLSRQRQVVAALAQRAEQRRWRFTMAQRELGRRVRLALASPRGMIMSFASGLAVGSVLRMPHRAPDQSKRSRLWRRARAALIRAMWVSQLYEQFRAGWQAGDVRQGAGGAAIDG
jgi:hypothetical protein